MAEVPTDVRQRLCRCPDQTKKGRRSNPPAFSFCARSAETLVDHNGRMRLNAGMKLLALLPAPFLFQTPGTSSAFNGTWLMDIPSSEGAAPESFLLDRNIFSRGDGASKLSVKADGRFHSIPGDGYVDAVAVTMLGSRKVRELDRYKGKLAYSVAYVVSADGSTLVRKVIDYSKPDGQPIPTTITYRRVGRTVHGASPLSGKWRSVGSTTTRAHLTETIKLDGTRFSSRGPGGSGYDATIGGPPVAMKGDAVNARAAVTMPNDRTIVVVMSQKEEATVRMTMTLLPDDRTIDVTAKRLNDGVDTRWTLRKQ